MKSLILVNESVNQIRKSNQSGFTFLDLLVAASIGVITLSMLSDLVARSSKAHAQLNNSTHLDQIAFEIESILADSSVCTLNLIKTFDKVSYFYDPANRPDLISKGRAITIASIDPDKSYTNTWGDAVVLSKKVIKSGTKFGKTTIKDIRVKHLSGLDSNVTFLNSVAQVEISFNEVKVKKSFPIRFETTLDKKMYRCFSYMSGQMESGMGDSLCGTLGGGTDWYGPYSGWVYDSTKNFCVKRYEMKGILVTGTQTRADCPSDTIRAEAQWPIVTVNTCGVTANCTVERTFDGQSNASVGNPFLFWLEKKDGLHGETCDWLPGSAGICRVYCYVPL